MLTPRFEITQTDDEITIIIHAPYANFKDLQIDVERDDFRFYAVPYYLRLNLPGEIEESPTSSGSYDCGKGDFTLKFSKINKGEFFPDLDMITTLLLPPKSKNSIAPKIEVIGNPANLKQIDKSLDEDNNKEGNKKEDNKEEDNNEKDNNEKDNNEKDNNEKDNKEEDDKEASNKWFIPQSINSVNCSSLLINAPKYGFANKISGAFTSFEPSWIKEIIDLPMPDEVPEHERKILRQKSERKDFQEEHYMADYVELEYAEPCLLYTPKLYNLKKEDIKFNKEEIDILQNLPKKDCLLNDEETKLVLSSLVDILYASCYNCRVTFGENTVESGWTINKLSPTLCWLQTSKNVGEVIIACIRRSLCYAQIRNWKLSVEVFEDVKQAIKLGKKYIIKLFCEIYSLFNDSHEPRYLLNQLYINDYLIWLQSIPESLIESLIPRLDQIFPYKENVNLDLIELEEAIESTIKDNIIIENVVENITKHTQNLHLNVPSNKKQEPSSDDDSSTSTDSSDIDTDSESDSSSSSSSSSTSVESSKSEKE